MYLLCLFFSRCFIVNVNVSTNGAVNELLHSANLYVWIKVYFFISQNDAVDISCRLCIKCTAPMWYHFCHCNGKWKTAQIFLLEYLQNISLLKWDPNRSWTQSARLRYILKMDWKKRKNKKEKKYCHVIRNMSLLDTKTPVHCYFGWSWCSLCPQEKITQLLCSDLIKYISSSSTPFLLLWTMLNVFNTVFQTHIHKHIHTRCTARRAEHSRLNHRSSLLNFLLYRHFWRD